MKHVPEKHENCDILGCPICDGGLFVCIKCRLAEGSLTTDCPGVNCWTEKNEAIYSGKMDFRNGEWVNECSPHSPCFRISSVCSNSLDLD